MDDKEIILALGKLQGSVEQSRIATDEKLILMSSEIKEIKEQVGEHHKRYDKIITEMNNNFRWVKRIAQAVVGILSFFKVGEHIWWK